MDAHVRRVYQRAYRNVDKIIEDCIYSEEISIVDLFPEIMGSSELSKIKNVYDEIEKLQEMYKLPLEFKILYSNMPSCYHNMNYEGATFTSLRYMCNRPFKKERPSIVLADLYTGMGWFKAISWDTKLQKLYIRLDGGSNGYDWAHNHNFFTKSFDPSDARYKEKLFDFSLLEKMLENDYGGEEEVYNDKFLIRAP